MLSGENPGGMSALSHTRENGGGGVFPSRGEINPLIKPNAGHLFPPEISVNTSPVLIAAVIKELRKAEPREFR
jgi:uncharacterized protein (DUF362 family)